MITTLRQGALGTRHRYVVLVPLVLATLAAYGETKEQTKATPAPPPEAARPQVEPRFSTAEALLEHYNELAMATPGVDMRRLMDLYYAETFLQRCLIELQTSLIPLMEYDLALWDQFGEGMIPEQDVPRLAPIRGPARVIRRSDDRVTAEYIDRFGNGRILDLILVDGGWWISGRSVAQGPQHADLLAWINQREGVVPNGAVMLLITNRIRSGDFGSAAEAKAALESAMHGDLPIKMPTVAIEGATLTMGTPLRRGNRKYHDDEAPLTVTVDDFRIGKYPVTAEQMCLFLNWPETREHSREQLYNHRDIGPYPYSTITLTDDGQYVPRAGAAKAPANQVTWKGAALFCRWLSERTGRKYRLPTEAEWELAARGEEGRKWPWGNASPGQIHGLRYTMESNELSWRKDPPVGSYPANATPEGVHDMLAYVIGEWCANKYVQHPTPDQVNDSAVDLEDLESPRVVRGYFHRADSRAPLIPLMDWRYHKGRPWTRLGFHPIRAPQQAARYGFRVVEEIEESEEDPSSP
jgi:formylglycine-generating enzyme required for sulfatase activity